MGIIWFNNDESSNAALIKSSATEQKMTEFMRKILENLFRKKRQVEKKVLLESEIAVHLNKTRNGNFAIIIISLKITFRNVKAGANIDNFRGWKTKTVDH